MNEDFSTEKLFIAVFKLLSAAFNLNLCYISAAVVEEEIDLATAHETLIGRTG